MEKNKETDEIEKIGEAEKKRISGDAFEKPRSKKIPRLAKMGEEKSCHLLQALRPRHSGNSFGD